MLDSLLIANRGEIACRILATCRRLGIRGMVVYSEADRHSLAVRQADEAICIGPGPAPQSYLRAQAVVDAALRCGAQAVHPGFGFLAENAEFAELCLAHGLIWVGPRPDTIRALGDKAAAKELARAAGVCVLPEYALAGPHEFPLMVKALAGGGGRGMRWVERPEELPAALDSARSEARSAFGDERVLLEKALTSPRHVEVQIFGDKFGQHLTLGERDCSLQRRHQKVLEESPAPHLTDSMRQNLTQSALRVASAAGYENAGTVEFLVAGEELFFLEVNTRLQVEHPVTECVFGQDLVEWQLRLAVGQPLPAPPAPRGHAIEVRLYAEDPLQGYRPSVGPILLWRPPAGARAAMGGRPPSCSPLESGTHPRDGISTVRVDSGVTTGDVLSPFYDSMVAKLIVHGPDRAQALARLRLALEETRFLGLPSNLEQLRALVCDPQVQAGQVSVGSLLPLGEARPPLARVAAAAALHSGGGTTPFTLFPRVGDQKVHASGRPWRNNPGPLAPLRLAEGDVPVQLLPDGFLIDGHAVRVESLQLPELTLCIDGRLHTFTVLQTPREWWVADRSGTACLPLRAPAEAAGPAQDGCLRAPLTGLVTRLLVAPGDTASEGQPLLCLEAMKMEHTLVAPFAGSVEAVSCQVGQVVEADAPLIQLARA